MSYTPTSWHKGDKVTTEKLNKIEQGIVDAEQSGGGGVFVVGSVIDEQTGSATLDKTWQEIHDAMANGQVAYTKVESASSVSFFPLLGAISDSSLYTVITLATNSDLTVSMKTLTATTADSYPVMQS